MYWKYKRFKFYVEDFGGGEIQKDTRVKLRLWCSWEWEVIAVETPGIEEVEKLMTKYLEGQHREDAWEALTFWKRTHEKIQRQSLTNSSNSENMDHMI